MKRRLPLPALVEAAAGRPADLFGLHGRKGRLLPGYDADFVVFDPLTRWTFEAARSHSSARHSPYQGRELMGRPRATYLREAGRRAIERGASVLVLGCAGMAPAALALERELGVAVVEPVEAGIREAAAAAAGLA